MQIRHFLRSYSFRSAVLIFLAFSVTLVAVRLTVYVQSLRTTYSDIRLVIEAHATELGENIERYGAAYASTVADSVLRDAYDDSLYIGLDSATGLTGNFPGLPVGVVLAPGWSQIRWPHKTDAEPLHLYINMRSYPDGTFLLIGYSLEQVDQIKSALAGSLFENVELALLLALLLTFLLVWLLNRHVRKFNTAFENVSHGNLGYRMDVRSQSDQFDRLAKNLNDMLDWLANLLEMSRDMGNSLAHDLRTPLSRHRLELCAIAESADLPDDAREKLDASIERLDDLSNLLNSVLTIHHAESQAARELFERLDLSGLVESVVEFYMPMVDAKQQELRLLKPATAVMMAGDRQLLSQAVVNLVDNAIKYTGNGGAVTVELGNNPAGPVLVVSDTGGGVAAADLSKVKQRFFRADSSRNTPGSGLGLSLVEAVAKLHHGEFLVENTDTGFRATLRFGVGTLSADTDRHPTGDNK